MTETILTAERVREVLDYDPNTGIFTWLVRTANCIQIGDIAGTNDRDGYRRIKIDGEIRLAHRIAFLYVNGVWPSTHIDHINGERNDNRMCNLREAPNGWNSQNLRRAPISNKTSGLLGVSWHIRRNRWSASIGHAGKQHYLGLFDSPEDAHAVYLRAKSALHEFSTLPHTGEAGLPQQRVYSSKYVGVCWGNSAGKWLAHATINGEQRYIGQFETEEEAHEAYLKAKYSFPLHDSESDD